MREDTAFHRGVRGDLRGGDIKERQETRGKKMGPSEGEHCREREAPWRGRSTPAQGARRAPGCCYSPGLWPRGLAGAWESAFPTCPGVPLLLGPGPHHVAKRQRNRKEASDVFKYSLQFYKNVLFSECYDGDILSVRTFKSTSCF